MTMVAAWARLFLRETLKPLPNLRCCCGIGVTSSCCNDRIASQSLASHAIDSRRVVALQQPPPIYPPENRQLEEATWWVRCAAGGGPHLIVPKARPGHVPSHLGLEVVE